MPTSRNRKKKRKKGHTIKKEFIDHGWGEIIRKGNKLFLRNKMTSEQHVAYMNQLKENRPKVYEEIKVLISELVTLINQYDKLLIMGGIASYGYMKAIEDPSDDGISEVSIEYCQSIALATPNINAGVLPDNDALVRIYDLLIKIRHYFDAFYSVEKVTGRYSDIDSEIRYGMILETLYIRGEGYMVHVNQLFLEMFEPHNSFFQSHYGFVANDIIETFEKLEESLFCRVMMPDGRPHPIQTRKLTNWIANNRDKVDSKSIQTGEYLNEFAKSNPEVLVRNNGVILYRMNSIDTYEELFKIRHFNEIQEKVVKSVALKFGQNEGFAKPEKFQYEVLNRSQIYANPIIEDNGNFFLFGVNLAARNYFLIARSLIEKADVNYYEHSFLGNKIEIAKDEFIERKVLSLFQKMLPNVNFYQGVKYNYKDTGLDSKCTKSDDGNYELDTLGISNKATYVIEVKAGLVSDEAKRGAILSIKTDLTNIVGDAICQSYRAWNYIKKTENPIFTLLDGNKITPINRANVFRISISFSYVGSTISGLLKLQQFGIIEESVDFASTINVFDLMAFSELIDSEDTFIDYLSKRIELYKDARLVNADEMDMLGLYFDNNLKIDKAFKDSHFVHLEGYQSEISRFFEANGKRPRKKKPGKKNNIP